ncbi:MAG: amidohydrolase family protein [bacterium]
MIIDGHTHIFPHDIQIEREKFFYKEPHFSLLYDNKKSQIVGVEELIATMDKTGVAASVVFGFPFENDNYTRKCNEYILNAMELYPGRIIGFCCVNPLSPDFAQEEIQRCLRAGMRGIGELAFYSQGLTNNALHSLSPIADLAQEYNVPICLHTNESVGHQYPGKSPMDLRQIHTLLILYPDTKFILAHWGGGFFFYELMKKEMADITKNIYYDTAASPFLYHSKIYSIALSIIGPERIIYGSDYPLLDFNRYRTDFKESNISKHDREKIQGKNCSLLLNL